MSQINACAFSISNTPGTAGGFTVAAAIAGPYRVPGAGHDGLTFRLFVYEGSAFEICDAVYTHESTSFSRGAMEDSSSGSRINFTAAAKVHVVSSTAATALTEVEAELVRELATSGSEAYSTSVMTANGIAVWGPCAFAGLDVQSVTGAPITVNVYDALSATGDPIVFTVTGPGTYWWDGDRTTPGSGGLSQHSRRQMTQGIYITFTGTARVVGVMADF